MGFRWRSVFIMVIIAVAFIVSITILKGAIQTKRIWIDRCVISEWEKNPPHSGNVDVRDYCLAKYREIADDQAGTDRLLGVLR